MENLKADKMENIKADKMENIKVDKMENIKVDKMENINSNDFREYLHNRVQPSMFLRSTPASEIFNIIKEHLNLNKSCRLDKVNVKFVISAADVIVPVFAHLCNACFEYGIFPHCLKTAKVIPIHKSGDKST